MRHQYPDATHGHRKPKRNSFSSLFAILIILVLAAILDFPFVINCCVMTMLVIYIFLFSSLFNYLSTHIRFMLVVACLAVNFLAFGILQKFEIDDGVDSSRQIADLNVTTTDEISFFRLDNDKLGYNEDMKEFNSLWYIIYFHTTIPLFRNANSDTEIRAFHLSSNVNVWASDTMRFKFVKHWQDSPSLKDSRIGCLIESDFAVNVEYIKRIIYDQSKADIFWVQHFWY